MGASERYLSRPWLKHYQEGVPASVEVPLKSVTRMFDEATERAPNAPRWCSTAVPSLPRVARSDRPPRLRARRARREKGRPRRAVPRQQPQFIIAYFAALKCGAAVTPISPVYTSHEVRYQLEDSGARAVICQDILYEKVAKAGVVTDLLVVTNVGEYLPAFKRLFSRKIQTPSQAHQLQDLLKRYPPRPPDIALDPKTDIAALPTPRHHRNPKGVMLSHYNLVAALVGAQAAFTAFEPGKEVILAFLPFFHIYGQAVIMLNGLCQGNLLVLLTSPDTEAILTAMERYQAQCFTACRRCTST